MPKLPNQKFEFKSDSGEKLIFVSEVIVSNDGEFSLTIPMVLEEVGKMIIGHKPASLNNNHAYIGKKVRSEKLWVCGKTMKDCQELIAAVSNEYLKCEVTTERIIVYGIKFELSVWKKTDGSYLPNGMTACGDGNWIDRGKEFKRHCGERSDFYTVGIAARVFDKITYQRPSGSSIKYEWISADLYDETYLGKLNSFIGLDADYNNNTGTMKEMPYTEEAAKFFYDVMIGLCAMADKISMFLSDKDKLELAIKTGNHLLT